MGVVVELSARPVNANDAGGDRPLLLCLPQRGLMDLNKFESHVDWSAAGLAVPLFKAKAS